MIIYGVIFNFNSRDKKLEIDKELDKTSKQLQASFDAIEKENSIEAESTSSILHQDEVVINTISKSNYSDKQTNKILRNNLQTHLEPLYQMLRTEGIVSFHFVLPNNISFLRMHKPSHFGDNLSSIRFTYNYVNRKQKQISGLEDGVYNLSYRYVFPLFNSNKLYIGAYEISYSIKYMQDLMQNIDNIKTDFLLKNDKFKKEGFQDKYKEIELKRKEKKNFTIYTENNSKIEIASFLPLKNTKKNKTLAYLVSYTNSDYIQEVITRYRDKNIIIFFTLFIILILLYRLTLHQQKIKEERERFQLAIDSSNDGIWDWNIKKNRTYFSPRYKAMLGFKKGEIEANFKALQARIHEEDKDIFLEELDELLSGKTSIFECEYRVKHKDGSWIWILGRAKAHFNKNNKVDRVVGFHSDITLKKEFENGQEQLIKQLKDVADAKSNFLATMSHEIRTPMNAIFGFVQILLKKEDDPKKLKMLNTANESGKSLLRIINDILDFSKLDSKKMLIEKRPFDIRETFMHVKDLYQSKAQDNSLNIVLNIDEKLPERSIGDKIRVEQIASNLLSNAIKFSNYNSTVKINVIYIQETHSMKCEIIDRGIGIPSEKLSTIFSAFTQEDSSTTRKYGGTGLGLSISKKLCELMDGKIGVESKLDAGSTFYFTLPLYKSIDSSIICNMDALSIEVELKEYMHNAQNIYTKYTELGLHDLDISDYTYSVGKAAQELDLDDDLIEDLVTDFVSQIIANKPMFLSYINDLKNEKQNKQTCDYTQLRNLAHKNLGVARNLRIENAQKILTKIMTEDDLSYLILCLNTLEASVIKLKPKTAFKTAKLQEYKNEQEQLLAEIEEITGIKSNVLIDELDNISINMNNILHLIKTIPKVRADLFLDEVDDTKNLMQTIQDNKVNLLKATGKSLSENIDMLLNYFKSNNNKATIIKSSSNKNINNLTGNILIVEDNETNQLLLSMILNDYNLKHTIANDGIRAIKILKDKKFDLILMDENMPNMNGIEATKIIRTMKDVKNIPIVAVTANAVDGDKERFLSAGMNEYMAKPIIIKELDSILNKYLSKRKR
jgi:PAS domain S-box-containing protein